MTKTEFLLYQLADRLNMTVGELRRTMSQKELLGWVEYIRRVDGGKQSDEEILNTLLKSGFKKG